MGKYFRVIIFFTIFVAIVSFIFSLSKKIDSPDNIVGGDRDEHGCIGSAGYSWCEPKQKCIRVWEESCEQNSGGLSKCGIENCHGLEIKCGSEPAEMCTAMYAIGDKCRQYASCGFVDENCVQIQYPRFESCKKCVEECIFKYDGEETTEIFDCESKC